MRMISKTSHDYRMPLMIAMIIKRRVNAIAIIKVTVSLHVIQGEQVIASKECIKFAMDGV